MPSGPGSKDGPMNTTDIVVQTEGRDALCTMRQDLMHCSKGE